jgi:hypothetical protein
MSSARVGTGFRAKVLLLIQETLEKLYNFNKKAENWVVQDYTPGTKKKLDQWGGGHARCLLQLACTIAFSCLLRVDEVLKIQSNDFVLLGGDKLQLTLRLRKTSQFGGVSNFAVALLVLIISPCRHQAICDAQAAYRDVTPLPCQSLCRLAAGN